MFAEDGFTGFLYSEILLTRTVTIIVLIIFLNNMKLFVYESGDRWKVADHKFLTRQRCSIARIRNQFLRPLTAATLKLRPPAATIDSVTISAPLQGTLTGDDDVPTALEQQGAPGTSDNVVTAALEKVVKQDVDTDSIKPVPSTKSLCNCRQRVDFSYNEEDRDNKEDENHRPTTQFGRRAPVNVSPLTIANDSASPLPTESTRRRFDDGVPSILPV